MNDTPPFTAIGANELTANVTAIGIPARTGFEITPDLRSHADAVLAMDPVNDVPPPYDFPEGHRWPAPRLTALPVAQRREVEAKLAALPPEQRGAKEVEFTAAAIRSMTAAVRIQTGVGKNATPFHREMVGIAREVQDLNHEFDRLQTELDSVHRYDASADPVTGEAAAVPVYAVTGTRAKAYVEQQRDILRRIRLLVTDSGYGLEGRRRMDSALHESATASKQRSEQIAEAGEAKQRAEQINRERRIHTQAERLASLQRNDS